MIRQKKSIAAVIAAIVSIYAPLLQAEHGNPGYARGYILVKPKAGVSDETYAELLGKVGAAEGERHEDDWFRKVVVPVGAEKRIADEFATNPLFEWAQPDYTQAPQFMPTEFRGIDWSTAHWQDQVNTGYLDHQVLNDFDAWNITRGAGQRIAIIDSGVDASSPNLAGQIAEGGWNFYFNDSDTASPGRRVEMNSSGVVSSGSTHGTKVATTAVGLADNEGPAAGGNIGLTGQYRVGVAPEGKIVPFVSVRSSDKFGALSAASRLGIRIVNISLGSTTPGTWVDPGLGSAAATFKASGGLVVNGAGNANNGSTQPSSAENALILVGAASSGSVGNLASYSNRGPSLDFCAPEFVSNGGGTSNAAPAVSAALALVWSINPGFTNVEVEQILKDAAAARMQREQGKTYYSQDCVGKGLDVGGAVALAVERARRAGAADQLPPQADFVGDKPAQVNGVASIDVAAGDDRAVAKVVLEANGVVLGEDVTAPYSFVLDGQALIRQGLTGGTLMATAYDYSGKSTTTSRGRSFTVYMAPPETVPPKVWVYDARNRKSIANKAVNASKIFTATFRGSDNVQIDSVHGYVDGQEMGTVSPVSNDGQNLTARWNVDTRHLANGSRKVKVVALDAAGNTAATSLRLRVKNKRK
jgi:hypothetical protein